MVKTTIWPTADTDVFIWLIRFHDVSVDISRRVSTNSSNAQFHILYQKVLMETSKKKGFLNFLPNSKFAQRKWKLFFKSYDWSAVHLPDFLIKWKKKSGPTDLDETKLFVWLIREPFRWKRQRNTWLVLLCQVQPRVMEPTTPPAGDYSLWITSWKHRISSFVFGIFWTF